MIEIKKYHEHPDRDFKGNPLITYLPYLSYDVLRRLMRSEVAFYPEDVKHDWEVRLMYPMRLARLFIPQDHQVEWAMKLMALIWRSYVARNPDRPSTTAAFIAMVDSVVRGEARSGDWLSLTNSPWCAVLIGTPGTGKSATAKALLNVLGPDLFFHSQHGALYQLLSLRVEAVSGTTGKSLAMEVFIKLREAARLTGQPFDYLGNKVPTTKPDLEQAIKVLASRLSLGILVLDELQHLFKGTGAMDDKAMEFLTSFVNNLEIPILMIGTWKAAGLLALEARLGRRGVSPNSAKWGRMRQDENWDALVKLLLAHQYTEKRVEFSPGLSELLYAHTQGIQDIAVKLFVIAQMEAIASGEEELTLTLVDRVADEHLKFIAPAIRKLKGEAREDDPILWDVEPEDFDEYVAKLNAGLQLRAAASRKRVSTANTRFAKVQAVATGIAVTGAASQGIAYDLATSAVDQAPGRSVQEHVVSILESAKPKGPKPTRSVKKQATVDAAFEKLDDDDLRKIVYLASRRGVSAEQALDEKGCICHPLEELTL